MASILIIKSNLLLFLGTSNGSTRTCTSTDQKIKEQEKGALMTTNRSANRKMSDFSTQDVEKSTNSNVAKSLSYKTTNSSANRKMSDFSTQDVEKSTNSANAAKSLSHKKREQGRERALFILVCCITFTFFIYHLRRYSAAFIRRPEQFYKISQLI